MVLLSENRSWVSEREGEQMTASVVKCEPRLEVLSISISPQIKPPEKERKKKLEKRKISGEHKRHEFFLLLPSTQLAIKRHNFSRSVYDRLSNYIAIHTCWIQFTKAQKWIGQPIGQLPFTILLRRIICSPQNASTKTRISSRGKLFQQPFSWVFFSLPVVVSLLKLICWKNGFFFLFWFEDLIDDTLNINIQTICQINLKSINFPVDSTEFNHVMVWEQTQMDFTGISFICDIFFFLVLVVMYLMLLLKQTMTVILGGNKFMLWGVIKKNSWSISAHPWKISHNLWIFPQAISTTHMLCGLGKKILLFSMWKKLNEINYSYS